MNKIVLNTPFLFGGEYMGTYLEKFAQREMTVSEFRKIKRALDDEGIRHLVIKGLSYPYARDICDVDLVFDDLDGAGRVLSNLGYVRLRESGIEIDFGKKFKDFDVMVDAHKKLPGIHYGVEYPLKRKLMLDPYERLLLCCAHTYQERRIILRDLIDLEYLLRSVDLNGIRIRERGVYELLGAPLITLHLFDRRYNGGSNKALADFVMRWYPTQVKTIADLLERRNYDLPLHYLNFYVETKLFGIHKFLKPPVFYSTESKKYFPFTPLIWLVTRVKGFMLMRYSTRPLADIEDAVS